jgi:hypothetical protein
MASRRVGSANAVAWGLLGLLLAVAALRAYAGFFTIPVRTWDDVGYRGQIELASEYFTSHGGAPAALRLAVRPHPVVVDARRSLGYVTWLIVVRQALPSLEPERAYQLANMLMLALQAALVWYLARPAGRVLALSFVCLYLTTPFVFGVSRWIWTENHVMVALLALPAAGLWLAEAKRRHWWSEALVGAAAGIACAVSSSAREYIAPSIALVTGAILFGLLMARRWTAAGAFAAATVPHFIACGKTAYEMLPLIAERSADTRWYHPLSEWAAHCVRHVSGYPMLMVVTGGLAVAVGVAWKRIRSRSFDLASILLYSHLLLVAVYVAAISVATNRDRRAAVPILWSAIGAIAAAWRLREAQSPGATRRLTAGLVTALALSLCFFCYDLFVAYDGGPSFVAHGFQLNTAINHPLWLSPPAGEGGMHVTIP